MTTTEFEKLALQEMFHRVGLEYTFEEIEQYAEHQFWYTTRTWTQKQETAFRDWFVKTMMKKTKHSQAVCERAAGWFILNYSWKVGVYE